MTDDLRRERYRQCFRSLFEVARALTEDLAIEEILRRIAREACVLVHAAECSIMLLDARATTLLTAAAYGLSPEEEKEISFEVGEGVAGWVVSTGQLARIDDVARDSRFKVEPSQEITIQSMMAAPLVSTRGTVGVISVTHPDRAFDNDDEDLLILLADAIVLDLEIVRLRHLAYRDPLTNAWSRQGMDTALEVAIRGAWRDDGPLSIVLLDLDHFKSVNDELGHQFGDKVLVETVRRIREIARSRDQLFRYGGDEFLVIAPGADRTRAEQLATRAQEIVGSEPMEFDGKSRTVTISCGVATLERSDAPNGTSLVARADEALLAIKRNRDEF